MPEPQVKLIEAIHTALKLGQADEHEAVRGMRDMMLADFEASFHAAFLIESLDELERMIANLREQCDTDSDLKGRITIGMNRARLSDAAIDARLDASPLFGDCTRYAYGRGGVQVFIETDLLKAGQLGDAMVLEFDYVFPDQDSHILSVVEM